MPVEMGIQRGGRAAAEKVAWTVNEISAARRFDVSTRIVPASWVRIQPLEFLDEPAHRALNQIRAFSYVHLFGNYEEFIPIHLTSPACMVSQAREANARGHIIT